MKRFCDDDSGEEEATIESKFDASIKYQDSKGRELLFRPNPKLKPYKDLFTNLLKTQSVKT